MDSSANAGSGKRKRMRKRPLSPTLRMLRARKLEEQRRTERLRDLDKPFPVSARQPAWSEHGAQGRLSSSAEHERHHRNLSHLRADGVAVSAESSDGECWATAEASVPEACRHSQRSRSAAERECIGSESDGGAEDDSSSELGAYHDGMVCGHKHEAPLRDLVYALCKSGEEEEESDGGEADGMSEKPAYSRRDCPPCSPAGEMPEVRYPGMVGVYMYTFPNGKRYVGQSVNIKERWWSTAKDARAGVLDFPVLRAIRKYGWDNVTKEVLLVCPQYALDYWEIAMVDAWDSLVEDLGGTGYNAIPAGQARRGRQIGRSIARSNTWARKREVHGDEWEKKRVDALRRKYEEKGWDKEVIATKMENARRAKATRLEKYAGTHSDGRLRTSERRNATWRARQEAHAATLSPVSRARYWRKVAAAKRGKMNARAKRKAEQTGNFFENS